MKTREGRWKQMVAIGAALALLAAFFWWQNNGLTVSRYEFTSTKVPRELDGYTIVQLSDLHNHRFGDGQRRLLKLVEELEPDLVLMTGDLVDRNRTDLIPALELAKGTSELAPTYYITGNHEWSIADRERTELLEGMTEAGVVVLEDRCAVLPVGESCLVLADGGCSGWIIHPAGPRAPIYFRLRQGRSGPCIFRPRPRRPDTAAFCGRPLCAGAEIPAQTDQRAL